MRRISYLIVLIISVIALTGCAGDPIIGTFLATNLSSVMQDRQRENLEVAETLRQAGLLSYDGEQSVRGVILNNTNAFTQSGIEGSQELQRRIFDSLVGWNRPVWVFSHNRRESEGVYVPVNSAGFTQEEWETEVITRYIYSDSTRRGHAVQNVPFLQGANASIRPLEIIDGETATTINNNFGLAIYVLRPIQEATTDAITSIDELVAKVKMATEDVDNIDTSVLERYFEVALDENGEPVTLLDLSKRHNRAVTYSTGSAYVTDVAYRYEGGVVIAEGGNRTLHENMIINENPLEGTGGVEAGRDIVLEHHGYQVMIARVREFNMEAIRNIRKTIGLNPGQYLIVNINGINRLFLMEYPVHRVNELKTKEGSIDEFITSFKESDIRINIKTGKLIKNSNAWGVEGAEGNVLEDSDPYLLVGGDDGTGGGVSSFIIGDESLGKSTIIVSDRQVPVETGKIVLRDYLEATYAPGVVSGENVVVFGRRLRFLRFSGSKDDEVARFYNQAGNVIEDKPALLIDSFADMVSLLSNQSPHVRYIDRRGETGGEEVIEEEEDYSNQDIKDSLIRVDNLRRTKVNSIEPIAGFPGEHIGNVDVGDNNKPLFYAIAVRENMFETGIFSGWINSQEPENSLRWWVEWLANENRAYQYTINTTALENLLMGNYTFELQQEGLIILDLETIRKITAGFIEEDRVGSVVWFRTMFIILGYLLLVLSIIIMMCWVVDVNINFNVGILEKLSLGHWIAVRHAEGVSDYDGEKRRVIDFKGLVGIVLKVMVLGAVLLMVDVVEVVVRLVELLGGISIWVGNLLR